MLQPQFDNPVHDAQQVFRTLLAAMAEPLLTRALPVLPPEPPADLHPATAAALLTLLDGDVSLAADLAPATAEWLRFHTGVRLTDRPEEADFVLVRRGCALPALAGLRQLYNIIKIFQTFRFRFPGICRKKTDYPLPCRKALRTTPSAIVRPAPHPRRQCRTRHSRPPHNLSPVAQVSADAAKQKPPQFPADDRSLVRQTRPAVPHQQP